jgi:hypothetical protein
MAPPCHPNPKVFASGLGSVQISILVGLVLHCCSPTASSFGLLALTAVVLSCVRLPQYVSATGSLQSSLQAPSLGARPALLLQFDGWPQNLSLHGYPLPPGGPSSHTTMTLSHQAPATSLLPLHTGWWRWSCPKVLQCHFLIVQS